ncbi:GFA family protein [Ottowia sp.]|uniref:GFA family protein n=1 Tax=Ottowia sp. TaxID=1898956 RepID=UPI0039E5EB5E
MTATLAGQCFCGACHYTVEAPAEGVVHCHCTMCRRLQGAGYATWVSVPAAAFSLSARDEDVRRFAVSERTTRTFCARCGTVLHHVTRGYEGTIGLLAGTLREAPPLRPSGHYFCSDRAAWTVLPDDGLPLYGGESGFEPITR